LAPDILVQTCLLLHEPVLARRPTRLFAPRIVTARHLATAFLIALAPLCAHAAGADGAARAANAAGASSSSNAASAATAPNPPASAPAPTPASASVPPHTHAPTPAPAPAPAPAPTPAPATGKDFALQNYELTFDHLRTDPATKDRILTGNVRLTQDTALLTAGEIRITAAGVATARGHVVFTRGPMRLLATELTYDTTDGACTVTAPRLGQFPYHVSGKHASGTATRLTLTDATATYGEPGPFAPMLRAGTLTYTADPAQRIQTTNTRLGVGPASFLKVPRLTRGVSQPAFISNATVKVGYRANRGAFLDIGTLAPVANGLNLGGDAGYYTKRGLLIGPAAAYDIATPGGGRATGSLETGYIHDNGNRLTDINGNPVPPDRGFVTWKHSQTITPALRLFGQANYWSDSEVIRDFRSGQFYPVQQPDNFLEADYTGANYILSAFARAQFNPFHPVQQRLPEVRLDLLPSPIGVQGIYQKGQASAASLTDNGPLPDSPATITSNRLDAYYALYRPVAFKDIATLTPVFGARVTYYADPNEGKKDYTRYLGEIGFDAELHAAGSFDYKNERWHIDGLRHLITPRLSYRYIPQAANGTPCIPAIDDQTFSTYLQPLGLGDIRNIDRLNPANTLRLGLDNTLQTRDKTHGSRDLAALNLAADLRLDDTAPAAERDLSAIHADLALMPAPWLRFNLHQSFTPRDLTLREINTGLAINDGSLWTLRLSTHYLKNQINEYIAEGRYRLNETHEAYARVHYDSREHRFNERSIGIIQKLGHNLWTIRYGVTLYEGQTRESKFGFSIDVRLLNF
jgi:LPS-assembly protein